MPTKELFSSRPRSLGLLDRVRSAALAKNQFVGQTPTPEALAAIGQTPPAPEPPRVMGRAAPSSLLTRTPPAPTPYQTGQYQPGSFGDQNAKADAGLFDAGTFGAVNAEANGTGSVVDPSKPILSPTVGARSAVASMPAATRGPQQTERANPLVGDPSGVPGGATVDINKQPQNQAMGFSSRGGAAPAGQDAEPTTQDKIGAADQSVQDDLSGAQHVGGSGLYKRSFSNPKSAGLYSSFVKDLFGDGAPSSGMTA